MRTIYLERDSRLVNYYTKVWEAEADKVNFCKMWWGVILSPLALIVHGLIFLSGGVRYPVKRIKRHRRLIRLNRVEEPEPEPREESGFLKALNRIDDFINLHRDDLVLIAGAVSAVVILFGFTLLGVRLVQLFGDINWPPFMEFVKYFAVGVLFFLVVVAGTAIGIAILTGAVWLKEHHMLDWIPNGAKKVGFGVKRDATVFGSFMSEGYWAFKTRTCPKVEIIDRDNDEHYHGEGLQDEFHNGAWINSSAFAEYHRRYREAIELPPLRGSRPGDSSDDV